MTLKDKIIILISSERWGDIYISKHNYAIALAKRGNKVFFLDPIDTSLRPGTVELKESGAHPDLKVISYRPFFPMLLKFHLRPVFNILLEMTIRRIIKRFHIKPDIVWDFNCSFLYHDLSIFGAPLKIFNPVDFLAADAAGKKADMIISISDLILDQYTVKDVPRLKLNHGLGGPFALTTGAEATGRKNERLQVGYVGNLALDSMDRDIFLRIIEENPDLTFNIIGPVSALENNLGTRGMEDSIASFIGELRKKGNVVLHGRKTQTEVAAILPEFDLLLLCYKRTSSFRCDNSHKMIEYLSSGKVIVSTYLSSYAGSNLVEMSGEERNQELPALFKRVVTQIGMYNRPEMQAKRRNFALENTYENHISRIETFIEKNVLPSAD